MVDYHQPQAGSAAPDNRPAAPGFDVRSVSPALWRRRWWPFLFSLLFAAYAIGYGLTLSDYFRSTAQVLIDTRDLRVAADDPAPGKPGSDPATASFDSQIQIITSPEMLRRIVEREGLASDPEYAGPSSVLTRLFPDSAGNDRTERTAERLNRNLSVRRGERTFTLDITVEASKADKAASLANAFAAAYVDDRTNARETINQQVSAALTSRLNDLRDRIRQSEKQIEDHKLRKSIIGGGGKPVTGEQMTAVNLQLGVAQARAADMKTKLDQIEALRGQAAERGPLPEGINSRTLGSLRQQLGEAQRRATSLGQALGPQHPDLQAAQTALRDAQRVFAEEVDRVRNAARVDYDRAVGIAKNLQAQLESLKKDSLSETQDEASLMAMESELEVNRAVHQALLARAREDQKNDRVDATRARLIAKATPPRDRAGPARLQIVTAAAAGGLALGLILAALAAMLDVLRAHRALRHLPQRLG